MSRRAEEFAHCLRLRMAVARELPVDVERLADYLGIAEVRRVPHLVEDGRLERRDGRATVLVSERASAQRQRYTIAHELAHLLLAEGDADFAAMRSGDDDEERFCDAFAAALLLPTSLVRGEFRRAPRTLQTVRELAERTDTSLAASTLRLNHVVGWSHALLHWKRGQGSWRFRWGAGLPAVVHRRLRSAEQTSKVLEGLRGDQGVDRRVMLPVRVGGSVVELDAEISVRGSSALALVVSSFD